MGREVRMVPKDWKHPKDENGIYIPMHDESFIERHARWVSEFNDWQINPQSDCIFSEWGGPEPTKESYIPDWPQEQRTHCMMYETCTEGTPISPAFETPEELARWLSDNNASAFGNQTASYDAWLRVAKGGYACSAVLSLEAGIITSGVEGLT